MSYAVGIDIGGTHIDGLCLNKRLKKLNSDHILLPRRRNKKTVIKNLYALLDSLCQEKGLIGIGIGAGGIVQKGTLVISPNMPYLEGTNFRRLLSRRYKTRVVVDNDVNCLAFGEAILRGWKNFIAITLGTGVGGGIIIDGKLYRGSSFAGELGHMSIKYDGRGCSCGNPGCFEEYVSTRGIMRLSAGIIGRRTRPKEVFDMAKAGDKKALKTWEEYGKVAGAGLANLCYIFDPEAIVLGGRISTAFRFFRDSMKSEIQRRLFLPMPKIVRSKPWVNAFGAACMVLKS